MAKSLRSKWRRKMKAEKRVRYGKKENDRLIKMLTAAGDYQMIPDVKDEPVDTPESVEDAMDGEIIAEIPLYTHTDNANRQRSKSRHDRRRLSRRRSRRDESESDSEGEHEDRDNAVVEHMDTAKDKVDRIYNKRTKKDQFGQYPVWMSMRKVMKHKKRNKRLVSKAKKLKTKKV